MTPDYIDILDDLVIVGTATRTSLQTAPTDIPALWQTFMQQDLVNSLPRRSDDASIYAVYCDYESDFSGPYTMVLGVAVDAHAAVPAHTRRARIPRGQFASFRAEGDPRQIIWQTWQHINERWDRRADRRYIADFERYAPESAGGDSVKADVVVGLG